MSKKIILYICTFFIILVIPMVTVTVSVSSELKHKMDEFAEINWSEVARQAFAQKIGDLEFLQHMKSESTLSEKDAIRLGRKVSASLAKRHGIGS